MLRDEALRIGHRLRGVLEGPFEPRRMVRLHDFLRLVDRCTGLDFVREKGEGSFALAKILLADCVDLLDRQSEFPKADELPELRRSDADRVLRPGENVLPDPPRVALEGFIRFRDGLLEAGPFRTRESLLTCCLDDMQEPGESLRRLEGDLGPHPHRRPNPALRLFDVGGGPFEAPRDAPEPLGEGRERPHEQGEETVPDRVGGRGLRPPNPDPLGLEDPQPECVSEDTIVHALRW